jgi:peptide/nickel transport system permease protein
VAFLIKRLLLAVPILFGVSVVVFLTIKLVPGDPVSALLGPTASEQARADLIARLGLDDPLPVQYFAWLKSVAQGDLGTSISLQRPAGPLVMDAFRNTMILTVASMVLAVAGGVALGLAMALRRRGVTGKAVTAVSVTAVSVPQYTIALVGLLFAVETGLLPVGGMRDTDGGGLFDLLEHLILPTIASAIAPMGVIALMFAVAMREVLQQDYMTALRGRGLRRRATLGHAFHGALPSLLVICGLQVGYLLGGVIFVEAIFSWPGLGQLVYQAIGSRDLPVIQAGVLIGAAVLVLVNVLVDTAYGVIDPRVRQ